MSQIKVGDAVRTPDGAVGVASEIGLDGIGVTYSGLRERDQWPVQGFARYAANDLTRLVSDPQPSAQVPREATNEQIVCSAVERWLLTTKHADAAGELLLAINRLREKEEAK